MKGAVELGGTKTSCALFQGRQLVRAVMFPTADPGTCLARIRAFFHDEDVDHLGVAAFGPVIVDCRDPRYGTVLRTPKPLWSGVNIVKGLCEVSRNVDVDTDVNCACLGEYLFGGFSGDSCLVYVTVGTGIGAGVVTGGRPLHGLMHPEVGHVPIKRLVGDSFAGSCPFHHDCATALASGRTIEERSGRRGEVIPADDDVWDVEAYYLAQVVYSCVLSYSPDHIVIGGGVAEAPGLVRKTCAKLVELDNGYVFGDGFDCNSFLLKSKLGGMQALLGADALDSL